MRMRVSVICFLSTAGSLFAASPAWELAPPDAKILIGVDVSGLRKSSLTDSMTPAMRAQMQSPMKQMAPMVPGIELLEDIDSIFLASNGDLPAASKAAPALAPGKTGAAPTKPTPSFVLVISGTFPDEHLRPLLKGAHPSYKGINVYRGTGTNPIGVAILDEHTVLMGDEKSIYRAIDRKTTGVKAQGPLLARARELSASKDIWMVAQDASGALQKASGPVAAFASEIEGLDFGLALQTGFNMDITLSTKTEAGAQALSQLLATQMQTAIAAKLDGPKAEDFWRKVKVGADGKRMQVQIALTKEELQDNIRLAQEQRTSPSSTKPNFAPTFASNAGSAVAAPAPPPKPAGPRVIKIYGLDDGVHEVKLDQ